MSPVPTGRRFLERRLTELAGPADPPGPG